MSIALDTRESTETEPAGRCPQITHRSVDTLRGLTIFLMVFVNDLGRGAPSWMHHIQPPVPTA